MRLMRGIFLIQIVACFYALSIQGVSIQQEKEFEDLNNNYLNSLRKEVQDLAFLGCIKIAEEKGKEFVTELKKNVDRRLEQLMNDESMSREIKNKLVDKIVSYREVKRIDVESILKKATSEVKIRKSCAEQILKSTYEDTPDRMDGIKKYCKMIGTISDGQINPAENSLTFYLPETLDRMSPVLVLAYVARGMLNYNRISAKTFFSFVPSNNDIAVEVITKKGSKRIILTKDSDLLAMLESIMINFLPIVPPISH